MVNMSQKFGYDGVYKLTKFLPQHTTLSNLSFEYS